MTGAWRRKAVALAIIVENLSHWFNGLAVLQDINLTVQTGEIVAVLGPSGCGKSTLLQVIGGMVRPCVGSVFLAEQSQADRPVAFVFQDPTLLPWRSLQDNVGLPLDHLRLGAPDRKRRIAAALGRVGLTDFAGYYPKELSGGMQQRTNLARALVVKPAVLLMDEPLSGLDEPTRDLLLDDLVRLWGDSRYTCLYVTHSPLEAARLGHRVVVLSQRPGRVRGIIPIDLPQDQRRNDHPAILAALQAIRLLVRQPAAGNWASVAHD